MFPRLLLGFFSLILSAPALALAAASVTASPTTWNGLVNILVAIMNKGIGAMVFLAVALYFWGISSNILKFGEETDAQKKRSYFFWGIIIIFVMVSVPGILYLLQNTLFGSEAIPTSGPGYVARCPSGDC